MNAPINVPRSGLAPIVATDPDDSFISDHLEDADGDTSVAAHATRQFRQANPSAVGAEARAEIKRNQIDGHKSQRDRLLKARDRTPLFKHPDFKDRKRSLTLHERLKYTLFQAGSVGGIGLSVHVLATYISNSDMIPDLSGNYLKALLFASPPFALALGLKAFGLLPDFEEDRQRHARWLRCAVLASGMGFILSAAFAFAPHTVDVGALSDALALGSDPESLATKTIKTVAPYAVTLTHLFTEVALAPILAMAADAIHASGREVVEQFSERGKLLQDEIDRLSDLIVRLSDEAAVAAAEHEMLAAAERDTVRLAVNRRAELKASLNQHLANAKNTFKANLGSPA